MVSGRMKELLVRTLCIEECEITADSLFKDDLGADSIDLFDIFSSVENEYNIIVKAEELEKINTVGDLENYILINSNGV